MNPTLADEPHDQRDLLTTAGTGGQSPNVAAEGLAAWLVESGETVTRPLTLRPVSGGRSNLTYLLEDADCRRWVLRRPPLRAVIETAHDMEREHRMLSLLADSGVPVPRVVGLCTGTELAGGPFFVMEHVDGMVIRDEHQAAAWLSADARRRAGEQLVDVLAALHAVPPPPTSPRHPHNRSGYVQRQLRRLSDVWSQLAPWQRPELEQLRDRLVAAEPTPQHRCLIHGDFRLDNVIVDADGTIRAVLDWELSTTGEPLPDLGHLLVSWTHPGEPFRPLGAAPTAVAGFPSRTELASRYAGLTGANLADLGYYTAFACWRLAVILDGVAARAHHGAYLDASEHGESAAAVPTLLDRCRQLIDGGFDLVDTRWLTGLPPQGG